MLPNGEISLPWKHALCYFNQCDFCTVGISSPLNMCVKFQINQSNIDHFRKT